MEGKPAPTDDPSEGKDGVIVLLISILASGVILGAYTLAAKFGR